MSIYKKMNDIMKDIGTVTKDQKNQQQGFKFRGIDQFVNALYPALCKHGVFMSPSVTQVTHELKDVTRSNGKAGVDKHVHLQVEYTFYSTDGSSVKVGPIAAEGLDSGDKATNKALSAALKYALIQTFSVPTEDMAEGDLETPEIGYITASSSPSAENALTTKMAGDASTLLVNTTATVLESPSVSKSSFRKTKKTDNAESVKQNVTNGTGSLWE